MLKSKDDGETRWTDFARIASPPSRPRTAVFSARTASIISLPVALIAIFL
ncbi:hypothetical protein J2067_004755 [Erwinia rhapontici]|nr:hypothetical protein [Erwinia rhapontici]